jgi:bifunctional DNA-binding transcriptional regulator/antitoxin component of YhaV-PrlF toxin-antitoxin module
VIPKSVVQKLGWHAGDMLLISVQGECVVLQRFEVPKIRTVTTSIEPESIAE